MSLVSWNSFLRTYLVVAETVAVVPRVATVVAAGEGGFNP